MSFYQELRMSNLFPRRPATDRPSFMPDIDSGNVAEMLRSVIPTINSMEMQRNNRQGSLAELANRVRIGRRPLNEMPQGRIGRGTPFNPNINTQLGPELGPSPSQRMFLGEDARQRAQDFQTEQANTRFGRQIDEAKAKEVHDERMADKEVAAKTSLFDRDFAAKRAMSEMGFGHQKELLSERNKSAAEIAAANAAARRGDVETRERIRGEENRKTQGEKPVNVLPSQQDNAFHNKVQQMLVDNPKISPFIEKDENGMIRISDKATPQQIEWIKKRLGSAEKPTQADGQVIRQRNKTTGQIRVSKDGGKTWTIEK